MFRIDNVSAIAALPTPKPVGVPGFFTGGNPATGGVDATIVDADWCNMLQEEVMAVVVDAGLTPSKTDHTQLLQAIKALIAAAVAP